MRPFSAYELWYGRNEPPPKQVKLNAGKLNLLFQAGDLRYIRFAGVELIRRVYVAIRDVNWNTIPGSISDLNYEVDDDQFLIAFKSLHHTKDLEFSWQAQIIGSPDGKVSYTMHGIAARQFRYCRIGFCVLHPIQECAGRSYQATTPRGIVTGTLPVLIEPQRMEGKYEAPLFPSCSNLKVSLKNGLEIHSDFEGDLFEMEDQRNWTDGSFKTYCTPISLGYPHQAAAGQQFHQKVDIWVEEKLPVRRDNVSPADQPIQLSLTENVQGTLPKIGFGLPTYSAPLSNHQIELLSMLQPDHLKLELHFQDPTWKKELESAIQTALRLRTSLELAIFLADDASMQLEQLRSSLFNGPVSRFIIFHETNAHLQTTSEKWLELARLHLRSAYPDTPILAGTNGNFAELNRDRPDPMGMDGIGYTINPQVHSSDEASLIEALEAQADTVTTTRSFLGNMPVSISSITLKPPFNQAATERETAPAPGELPAAVDPRQMSLFCAAWTLGSVYSITLGAANSVTYYETVGWRGLLDAEIGNPSPEKFLSRPGMVFPVYHLFADLAEVKHAQCIPMQVNHPMSATGMLFKLTDGWIGLVSNLQPLTSNLQIGPLPTRIAQVRRLNDQNAQMAVFEPVQYRKTFEPCSISDSHLSISLLPYETIRFDIHKLAS